MRGRDGGASARTLYEAERGDIQMAFTGDSLVTGRLAPYREDRFISMAEILRSADVSFTNSETLFHSYEGAPIPDSGPYGTYAACDPPVIDDLRWLGINMVSTANNHCVDYGEVGIVTNLKNLDRYGMPHAGTGRNLSEAAAPAYHETPRGVVALIGVTLTMPPAGHRAGDPRGVIRGRPGANVVRHRVAHSVPTDTLTTLSEAGRALDLGPNFQDGEHEIRLFGETFVAGAGYGKRATAHSGDVERNLRSIREARRMSDWVIVSMHNHARGASADEPPPFAEAFARQCVEAGADVVFGHGPHRDRGIEVYMGRPIIHALGDFILQNDLIKWEPDDLFERYGLSDDATATDIYEARSAGGTRGMAAERLNWQSAIVAVTFRCGSFAELEIRPVDLGFGTTSRTQRGRPVLADGPVAAEVLNRFQDLSKRYGVHVDLVGDRGRVAGDAAVTQGEQVDR